MSAAATYHVKVRLVGKKRYEFLADGGRPTHLRMHALSWPLADAERVAAELLEENAARVDNVIVTAA